MRAARAEPDLIERRLDKPYDDEWPGHLLHPNGTLVDSGDRAFLGAAGNVLIPMFRQVQTVEVTEERL